jgi:hypothetical protein
MACLPSYQRQEIDFAILRYIVFIQSVQEDWPSEFLFDTLHDHLAGTHYASKDDVCTFDVEFSGGQLSENVTGQRCHTGVYDTGICVVAGALLGRSV